MTTAEFAAQLAELARNAEIPRVRPEASGRAHALIEQAARLYHLAVQIHPFLNGNGRRPRMLANIWLKRNRRPVTEWPEQVIDREGPVRGEYLQAIRAADEGDYEPLFELHRRFTASG